MRGERLAKARKRNMQRDEKNERDNGENDYPGNPLGIGGVEQVVCEAFSSDFVCPVAGSVSY